MGKSSRVFWALLPLPALLCCVTTHVGIRPISLVAVTPQRAIDDHIDPADAGSFNNELDEVNSALEGVARTVAAMPSPSYKATLRHLNDALRPLSPGTRRAVAKLIIDAEEKRDKSVASSPSILDQITEWLVDKATLTGHLLLARYDQNVIWQDKRLIRVCWENPAAAPEDVRAFASVSIAESWERAANIEFIGWKQCSPQTKGDLYLSITDGRPGTRYLGQELLGRPQAIFLNLMYDASYPGPPPQGITARNFCELNDDTLMHCRWAGVVHEFGHVLGFTHEQARPDTPQRYRAGACSDGLIEAERFGTTSHGKWDINSIMNYCNPAFWTQTALSEEDRDAARAVYGPPNWERAPAADLAWQLVFEALADIDL
jgi:hypothetical protein